MESTSTKTVSSRPNPDQRLTLARYVSPDSGYHFPSLYSFPPFFTKQPNPATWSHQRQQWIHLILSHSKHTKTSYFPPLSSRDSIDNLELFHNRQIQRSLPLDVVQEVLRHMSTAMNPPTIEFIPPPSGGCYVYWKTPFEWTETIYDWVKATGQLGTVLTLYELTETDDTLDFYQLPSGLLKKVLDLLQKQGKCQVLKGTLGEVGDGVKFV